MTKKHRDEGLDDKSTFFGFAVGLMVGGAATLLSARRGEKDEAKQTPQAIKESVREKLKLAAPIDPAADSIAEGKAAARRRLEELGMNK